MESSSRKAFAPPQLNKNTAADFSSSASESEDDYLAPNANVDDGDFGDFNPRKRRKLQGNNKERAALGVFGSDSEGDGPGRKWKSRSLRGKGVSFVSTAKDPEIGEDDDTPMLGLGREIDDEDDREDEESGAGLGMRFRGGLNGFKKGENGESSKNNTPEADAPRPTFQAFAPSSAREPVLKPTAARNASPPRNKAQVSSFGAKGKSKGLGFGAKMLAKMGYVEGQGLGKEGEGRNVIIEANLRPQGVGLGAVKEKGEAERQEEKRQARLRGEVVVDSDEEEKKRKRRAKRTKSLAGAFDSATSTPKRQKPKYLTAEELRASAPGLNIPDAFTPILDMTGPGGKMLTSTSGIMTPSSGIPESTEIIETRKLVKRAQNDLAAFSEEWRSLEERKKWVALELSEREREVEDLRSVFERLQVFSNLVSQEVTSASEWEQVVSCLHKAVNLGSATPEMVDILVAVINPFIRDSNWDPLEEPARFATDLEGLGPLLLTAPNERRSVSKWESSVVDADGVYRTHHKATTAYESMMYKTWLPKVLTAIRKWDPLEPAPMLNVAEQWDAFLPPFVRAQLIDNVVRRLESLVAEVRRKFRQLIDAWEFKNGVVPGLIKWETVLGEQWRSLIMSHVLPAMSKYLGRHFRVDPADQEPYLKYLTGVFKWQSILGTKFVAEVLVQSILPMWNAKLAEWVALAEADLTEVAEWYTWWRDGLLKDYSASDAVCEELDKGLRTMNAF
ncbi:G-patch domain-containing protein -like protein [Emericellopsis cladophorae]|uniref:G-patch domain-containing protein -like protein n=1 Tax=Emericellopsis cladophorae TaxID=2686198 RepID=A0A9P9XU18_9HYPO|nr:G-patch domain-containing protein -like protein [Emericellopsis cladophorae]KAI6777796.1 G-patch domain-containing protein -like protein [Emericellopsis cladophorae]